MNSIIILSVCIAAVASSGFPDGYDRGTRYAYHGRYAGSCGNDGFYYKDHGSFVICSNGNAYDQPCAPGSRNSGFDHYTHGGHYYYRDFCDINLVDYGYGAHHGGYGSGYDGAVRGYGARYGAGYGAGYNRY